jgi:hypothetical protein
MEITRDSTEHKEKGEEKCHLVEVFGSLLNPKERMEVLKNGGRMEERGVIKRAGWQLSFDKYNINHEAVLNLVNTNSKEDIYYTKVYKTDEKAFETIMEREMGPKTADKWRRERIVNSNSYKPMAMSSDFGETCIFLIPEEGHQNTSTNIKAKYVNIVKDGIIHSFQGRKRKNNLRVLFQAISRSAGAGQMFKDLVEDSEEKYGISDCIYKSCVKEFSQIKLNQLKEKHELRIVRPFLLTWGNMTRVLGYLGVKAVCKKIATLDARIDPFRKNNLFSSQLEDLKDFIVKLFDEIRQTEFKNTKGEPNNIGTTAASKILHLICPDFFIMWDSKIRAEYRKDKADGENYFEFLREMKSLWGTHKTPIKDLERRFGKTHTRIIDQYNYMKAQWLNE